MVLLSLLLLLAFPIVVTPTKTPTTTTYTTTIFPINITATVITVDKITAADNNTNVTAIDSNIVDDVTTITNVTATPLLLLLSLVQILPLPPQLL